jgi:hypothetical protein
MPAWQGSSWKSTPHLPACQGQCFLFGEISPTGDKKKPSATSKKRFFKKNFQKIRHISLKKQKKRKKEFARPFNAN